MLDYNTIHQYLNDPEAMLSPRIAFVDPDLTLWSRRSRSESALTSGCAASQAVQFYISPHRHRG
jgi:hypothetical protein